MLVGLSVSRWKLALLWASKTVSALLGNQLSLGSPCVQRDVNQHKLPGAESDQKDTVLVSPLFLCPAFFWLDQLQTVIREKVEISPLGPGVRAFLRDQHSPGWTCLYVTILSPLVLSLKNLKIP